MFKVHYINLQQHKNQHNREKQQRVKHNNVTHTIKISQKLFLKGKDLSLALKTERGCILNV